VLVHDRLVADVSRADIVAPGARVVDLRGRTLMPGLIDCHVHICMPPTGMVGSPTILPSLLTARASTQLREMIMRGFTTVRDGCGADAGHRLAVEQGHFVGPRLFVSGRSISQTGGHGDMRSRADLTDPSAIHNHLGHVADGIGEVRRAVREELRLGADQIKLMAGGGVGTAGDPLDGLQYSREEIEAVVDEAQRAHTYVMAHAYTADAIRRCVESGVRTIEHGNLIDADTAAIMARSGAYLVPTLVAYRAIGRFGHEMPAWTSDLLEKAAQIEASGSRSIELAVRDGVRLAFGTDLGWVHGELQSDELTILGEVLAPAEVLRSATVIGAEVVRMPGKLGVVAPGAYADLLVVDGDPLSDLSVLTGQGDRLAAIMKDGQFVKDSLGSQ
jgi:imidazolonepropionase-like amidohydrolase